MKAIFGNASGLRGWAFLVLLSGLLSFLLHWAGLPGALLLGPLFAAMIVSLQGHALRLPGLPVASAQAMIGCLVASSVTPAFAIVFSQHWLLGLTISGATLLATSLLGYLMSRSQLLPGTTAVWGAIPGASSAMIFMAESYGADGGLVAFMQYLRVICVASAASVLSLFLGRGHSVALPAIDFFAPIDGPAFAVTLAVAGGGALGGRLLRLPAGALLGPLIVGAALNISGFIQFELPQWLLSASFMIVGWKIGMNFKRAVISQVTRALPAVLLSILILMIFCGGLAMLLIIGAGVDPVTAYLATSPGGIDSMAIIAAATPVDLPFVMALQIIRLLTVLMAAPFLASFVARRYETHQKRQAMRS